MRSSARLSPLPWLLLLVTACCCCAALRVCALVFDPIAPTIVSVTSPACAVLEGNGTRQAVQCGNNMRSPLRLKGTDWNGALEIPLTFLVTPLNLAHELDCELDADSGVVTVGHEAWEVSCVLWWFDSLQWWEQQAPLGLRIQDLSFNDASSIFYGVSSATPAQSVSQPVLYSIVGCMSDCRPSELVTITGAGFTGSGLGVVANGTSGSPYACELVSSSATQLVARLPGSLQQSDYDQALAVSVQANSGRSLNSAYLFVGSPFSIPVVLGLSGCAVNDARRRTTSGCTGGGVGSVLVQGRGWYDDLSGFSVVLLSPLNVVYECQDTTLVTGESGSDSFDAYCLLPSPPVSETYAEWSVAVSDDQNGQSAAYRGLSYAPLPYDDSSPLVARLYCPSGCYSGDVLVVEGQQLTGADVQLTADSESYFACSVLTQSDSRLNCVLPYLPSAEPGVVTELQVRVSNEAGSGEVGQLSLTQSPPVPRITAIYRSDVQSSCTRRSGMAVQNCTANSQLWVKSEGWLSDVNENDAQVVLTTPIGREVACVWQSSNFSADTGVMFQRCRLPLLPWHETVRPHSVSIAAPDSTDTWYWSDAITNAIYYTPTAPPSSALSLPAATRITLDCPTLSNVSYCTDANVLTVEGVRLASPVTAVLANAYAVLCEARVPGSTTVVSCQLPSIRPLDIGLLLEVDLYTAAGQAPNAYPPMLAYAASSPYEPSGVPIPAPSSSSAPPAVLASSSSSSSSSSPRASQSSSSSSSRAGVTSIRSSSSSSSSSVARGVTSSSSRSTAAPASTGVVRRSSSSSSTSAPARRSSSSSSSSSSARLVTSTSAPAATSTTSGRGSSGGSTSSSRSSSSVSSSSSSSSGPSDNSDTEVSPSGGMSGGAIAGIVVLVLLLALGGVAGVLCWLYGCPSWLRSRGSRGPRSVDELLSLPDSSMDGEGAGYVPPNYAANSANGFGSAAAAASYQPPNAGSGSGGHSYSNPYLPPSMRSSMLPHGAAASDDSDSGYVPPGGRYVPPPAQSRPSIFNRSGTVQGSVDSTDGYGGHTADDY